MMYTLYDSRTRRVDIKQCQLVPLANRSTLYCHFIKKLPHSCYRLAPLLKKCKIKLNNQSDNLLINEKV